MIRRDYFLRVVQEMTQTLARVLFLKHRQEYTEAMQEIGAALRRLRDAPKDDDRQLSLDDWLELCRKHEDAASGLLIGLADLLREQGELFVLKEQPEETRHARAVALGLYLEALLRGETFVSEELLTKVERLIEQSQSQQKPASLWLRLIGYHEARGRFDLAENVLFDWLDNKEAMAFEGGEQFYERMRGRTDAELEQGGLPRTEVEEGRRELVRRQG